MAKKVFDVADYILHSLGSMSAMKLQKLVYYSQAWSLVWDEKQLFPDEIEAWANGPVVRALYNKHRGHFRVTPRFFGGDISNLSINEKGTIDKVLEFYGPKDPQWLSNLTHLEAPWREARQGLDAGERGNSVITKEAMLEYYASL
ncbi:MAG: type II toxin-antitoxin system antitoxin SocA domain-containing protein [Terriglobales bacterium]